MVSKCVLGIQIQVLLCIGGSHFSQTAKAFLCHWPLVGLGVPSAVAAPVSHGFPLSVLFCSHRCCGAGIPRPPDDSVGLSSHPVNVTSNFRTHLLGPLSFGQIIHIFKYRLRTAPRERGFCLPDTWWLGKVSLGSALGLLQTTSSFHGVRGRK